MEIEEVAQAVTVNIGMSLGKILPVIMANPPSSKIAAITTTKELLRVAEELEAVGFPGSALFIQAIVDGIDSWIGGVEGFLEPRSH